MRKNLHIEIAPFSPGGLVNDFQGVGSFPKFHFGDGDFFSFVIKRQKTKRKKRFPEKIKLDTEKMLRINVIFR